MQPAPQDVFHDFHYGSFGGVSCAQQWCDFYLWEAVLNTNPQLTGIVELGTWEGGFSRYLYAQARAREMGFVTFDVIEPGVRPHGFRKLDIYRYPEQVAEYLQRPVALFCDGGNKPRELQVFPRLCAPDSIFLVHDWGTETLPEDVPETLEELYGDWCDSIGSVTRVFRMKP